MTTNHVEKLDPALLRPGRVDMKISFGYTSEADIKELFASIYGRRTMILRLAGPQQSTAMVPMVQSNSPQLPLLVIPRQTARLFKSPRRVVEEWKRPRRKNCSVLYPSDPASPTWRLSLVLLSRVASLLLRRSRDIFLIIRRHPS